LVFVTQLLTIGGVKAVGRVVEGFCVLSLGIQVSLGAEDSPIDKLLKKLPPPEKIIKPATPREAQQKDPALQDPLFIDISVLAYMGKLSEGRLYSRKLSEKYPQSEAALILWGEFAYRLRYFDEAAGTFHRATALAPRDAYAWMELAKAENSLGQIQTTLNAMAKAAEVSTDDGELAAVLGFSYINLNRIAQAIPPLQRAAKLLPQDYLVQSQLGYCLLITGETNAAIGHLQKGATLNSRYGPVWEHLGVAYKKQGRNRDAVVALENATRLLPSSPLAWKHLAEAYQATGRGADAQHAAARAQKLGYKKKA
jgi:Flp pilus assembly protein TadD